MLYYHKEVTALLNNKFQVIMSTTMLSYLVIYNSFFPDEYMVDIDNMKCQLHYLNLEQYYILENMINIYGSCVSITVYLLELIYIRWIRVNNQHLIIYNT